MRSYILRHLNACFFLEAGNLTEKSVNIISSASKRRPTFRIFLDSNVLFSVLGLHHNPSNEAAQALLSLINNVDQNVKIKLYVTGITKIEVIRVLTYHEQQLKNIRLTDNIVNVGDQLDLSGFAQKYFSECRNAGKTIRVEQYFEPYVNDFNTMVRAVGVEFFNDELDKYRSDQRVVDDIAEQMEFQKANHQIKEKSYEQLEHDVALWHFINDKRPVNISSPEEVDDWIVTVDFGYLAFDRYKSKTSIPVCLHPTSLIQILQLWIPRNPLMEEAILGNIRLPFLFPEFDSNTEKVTLSILQTISRYEDAQDLPENAIKSLVVNKVLRQKFSSAKSVEEQQQFIQEALIYENKKAEDKLKAASKIVQELKKSESLKENIIHQFEQKLSSKTDKLEEANQMLEAHKIENNKLKIALDTQQKHNSVLENRLSEIENQVLEEKRIKLENSQIRKDIIYPFLLYSLIAFTLAALFSNFLQIKLSSLLFAVCAIFIFYWGRRIDKRTKHYKYIQEREFFKKYQAFRTKILLIAGIVFSGIIGNFFYDLFTGESAFQKLSQTIAKFFTP